MVNSLVTSKKVLSICIEPIADEKGYFGGLGALYGDLARSMNRLKASYIVVSPIYQKGRMYQWINEGGVYEEYSARNIVEDYKETDIVLSIQLLKRLVKVKVWKHRKLDNVYGLDTFLDENGELACITNNLYGECGLGAYSRDELKMLQEAILGAGAIKLCRKLNYKFDVLHLNEDHSVFCALYLVHSIMDYDIPFEEACSIAKSKIVFTMHKPISAYNKRRSISSIIHFGANFRLSAEQLKAIGGVEGTEDFDPLVALLRMSRIANAVSVRHQNISYEIQKKIPDTCPITYIDNGIDIKYWQDPKILTAFRKFSIDELVSAHQNNKRELVSLIKARNGAELDENSIIICFAHRVMEYQRADLIFQDRSRFEQLIEKYNIQIVFSGKVHPTDFASKEVVKKLYMMSKQYPNNVVFLQNFDLCTAKAMVCGCDVWLESTQTPMETCSTSGMKAAANGALNLSTATGWWYKGARRCANGWIIEENESSNAENKAEALYKVLESDVIPTYYNKDTWKNMMYSAVYTAMEECSVDRMAKDYYAYLYNGIYNQ